MLTASNPLGPWVLTGTDIQKKPPRPPLPPGRSEQLVLGPLGRPFCGGIGGKEPAVGQDSTRDELQLECAGFGATIEHVSVASFGTSGREWADNATFHNCVYSEQLLLAGKCDDATVRALVNSTCGNATDAVAVATQRCVGKHNCTLESGPPMLERDPCYGTFKSLFVRATCTKGQGRVIRARSTAPPPPSHGRSIPSQQSFIFKLPAAAGGSERWLWGGDC